MVTRAVKVPIENTGKGFIQHAEREIDKLVFAVVYKSATHAYCYVRVADNLVDGALAWVARVGGTVMTLAAAAAEVQADITARPDTTQVCDLGVEHAIDKAAIWQEVQNQVAALNNV